jgi:3-oxoadipate enol-lactonase
MSAQTAQATAADGTRLSYTLHAKAGAPSVVLIHSLALDRSLWGAVVERLSDRFQVLTYDCRGHGASDHPPGPYDPFQFAADLDAVMQQAGLASAVVAGCSMGGCVAQALAANHPQRADGLVLIDTTAWYGAEAPAQWRERVQKAKADGLAGMIPFQTTRWFSEDFVAANSAEVDRLNDIFLANDIESYAASCLMLGDADLRGRLSGFSRPVAVVVGEEDYATPVSMAEALRDAMPGATLQVIPKGRHLTPVQCPDVVAEAIAELAQRG